MNKDDMRGARRKNGLQVVLCALLLSACALDRSGPDRDVAMSLTNEGAEPLRCRPMFGHWVDRDLGELMPGASIALEMKQSSKNGALYITRADGQRQMMIETLHCGRA